MKDDDGAGDGGAGWSSGAFVQRLMISISEMRRTSAFFPLLSARLVFPLSAVLSSFLFFFAFFSFFSHWFRFCFLWWWRNLQLLRLLLNISFSLLSRATSAKLAMNTLLAFY